MKETLLIQLQLAGYAIAITTAAHIIWGAIVYMRKRKKDGHS